MLVFNVRMRTIFSSIIVVAILMTLCACSKDNGLEETTKLPETTGETINREYDTADFFSVLNLYLKYIERSTFDSQAAVRMYVHYEQDWLREIALEQDDPTTGCEFLEIKKLNDKLWVIKTFITSYYRPEGFICDNFVGVIDGQLYVMVNLYNIPPELKEGLDLSEYHKEGMYE